MSFVGTTSAVWSHSAREIINVALHNEGTAAIRIFKRIFICFGFQDTDTPAIYSK